jgi:hypothetical protein
VNPLFAAAVDVERFCQGRGWEFCFIGALAVIRWGEPRLTRDVGLTILTGFGGEERYIDDLLSQFSPRRGDSDLNQWDTTVRPDPDSPLDEQGLRTDFIEGPRFGEGTAATHYPRWRSGFTGGRTFLVAGGFRF